MADGEEERDLRINVDANFDQAIREFEEFEQKAEKGVTVGAGSTNTPGQSKLADRYETKYENRLASDAARGQRELDQKFKQQEAAVDRAIAAIKAGEEADRRRANAVNKAASREAESTSRRLERAEFAGERRDAGISARQLRVEEGRESRFVRNVERAQFAEFTQGERNEEREKSRAVREEIARRRTEERTQARETRTADTRQTRYERNLERAQFSEFRQQERRMQETGDEPTEAGGNRVLGLRAGRLQQYLTIGFFARETANALQTYQQYQSQSAIAERFGDPEGKLKAEQSVISGISNIPILGQGASLLADVGIAGSRALNPVADALGLRRGSLGQNASSSDVAMAEAEAQYGQQAAAIRLGSLTSRRINTVNVANIEGQTGVLAGAKGGEERAIGGLQNQVEVENKTAEAEIENRRDEANAKLNQTERSAALAAANSFAVDRRNLATAKTAQLQGQITETRRLGGLRLESMQRQEGALNEAIEGRTGEAENQQFEAGLQDQQVAADERSQAEGAQQAFTNQLARRARGTQQAERTRRRGSRTRVTRALLNRDPFQAQLEQINEESQVQWEESQSDEEREGIQEENTVRRQLAVRDRGERTTRVQSTVRANRALLNRDPLAARLEDLTEQTRQATNEAFSPEEKAAIQEDDAVKRQLISRSMNESAQLELKRINSDVKAEDYISRGKEKTARAAGIVDEANTAAEAIRQQGGPLAEERAKATIQLGISKEKAFERQLEWQLYGGSFAGITAPGGIGPGGLNARPREENINEGLVSVRQAIKDLQAALLGTN